MGAALLRAAPDPGGAVAPPIRVLIVDDSAVVRMVLDQMLTASGRCEVVGKAPNAAAAEALLADVPVDVILLDVEMPGTDGLTALPRLLRAAKGARVVIVSSFCADGAAATVRALALGAADTILKPGAVDLGERFADMLVARLERIGGSAPAAAPRVPPRIVPDRPHAAPPPRRGPVDCIAIGASTGGIHALAAFFAALPRRVDVPILITQHLPAPFMPYFAQQVSDAAGRPAQVAAEGLALRPGMILVAPGDGHLTLVPKGGAVRVAIDRAASATGNLPSVDPMMASVADVFRGGAVGVMLSGMGRDGALGAAALVGAGGELLAQDEASSVVWGMPGVVARAGLASETAPPAALATFLGRRILPGPSPWN